MDDQHVMITNPFADSRELKARDVAPLQNLIRAYINQTRQTSSAGAAGMEGEAMEKVGIDAGISV
jgi:hypothetical protein